MSPVVPLVSAAIAVIGAVWWHEFHRRKFDASWPGLITLMGVIILVTSLTELVWKQPEHIRVPIAMAMVLLLIMWIFVTLPGFLLLRRHKAPLRWQIGLFLMPVGIIAILMAVFFIFGPLEAVWTLSGMVIIAGGYLVITNPTRHTSVSSR